MGLRPAGARSIKFEFAVAHRPMIPLAYVAQTHHTRARVSLLRLCRGQHRESYGVARSVFRRPGAPAGVSEIAERLQHVLSRRLALVTRSRAVPCPSRTQRKPRRMRPIAVLQSFSRHEVGAGQFDRFQCNVREPAIVNTYGRTSHPRLRRR